MLDNIDKKSNPFKIPENYFENFNMKIMEQLPEKEEKKARIVPLWKKIAPWTAVAAVFLGAMVYVGPLVNQSSNNRMMSHSISNSAATLNEDDMYQIMEDEVIASAYSDVIYSEMYPQ